jgi:transposase-like protein
MSQTHSNPQTLIEAIRYFSDPDVCVRFVAELRWPDGPTCPECGGKDHSYLATRRVWKCKACKKQFSVKVGTIFEDSPLGLDKWLAAIWLIGNAKNGVSSYEIHRSIGVTQKSAWFMLHRIRLAMQAGTFQLMSGEIEADETFIGGKARNMHKSRRERMIQGRGAVGKSVVMGLLERHTDKASQVRTKHVTDTRKPTLHAEIKANVAVGSELFTDALRSYDGLDAAYAHEVIDHAEAYAKGKVHTNGLENYWSLLKRCVRGTYIRPTPFHLFRYLDEQAFRFNEREGNDGDRFRQVTVGIAGKRLTYKRLTGKTE